MRRLDAKNLTIRVWVRSVSKPGLETTLQYASIVQEARVCGFGSLKLRPLVFQFAEFSPIGVTCRCIGFLIVRPGFDAAQSVREEEPGPHGLVGGAGVAQRAE